MWARLRAAIVARWTAVVSQEGAVVVLSANDLFWRLLADIRWRGAAEMLGTLADNLIVSASVSVLAGLQTEFRVIAVVAQWLLLLALFYGLAPRIFRPEARDLIDTRAFRLLTATIAGGYGIVVASFLLGDPIPGSNRTLASGIAGMSIMAVFGYGVYFRRTIAWTDLSPAARVDLLSRFAPVTDTARRELLADFEAGGRRARIGVLVWKGALTVLCLIPCFFLGLLAVLAMGLYPLVEVLVIGWVGTDAIARRRGLPLGVDAPSEYAFDLEARFYRAVATAGHGLKGFTVLPLVILFGLFPPVLVFVHAFALAVDDTAPLLIDAARDGVLVTLPPWNALGTTVCLLAVALYGIWYWTRTLRRLGPYLETWLRRHDLHADSDSGDRSKISVPTRPVGGMVPPMIVFVAVVWYVGTEGSHVGVIFGAVWPLTIALLIGGVALTARRDPQLATTDGVAVPIALLVQNGGLFSAIGAIGGDPGSLTLSLQPVVAFLVGTILWLYFFADVTQFAQGRTDRGRYAVAMYLAIFGVFTGILGLIETGGKGGPLRLLGAIALGSAAVFAVEKRLWPAE